MFPQKTKNRCACDKRISSSYLSDPLNFYGLWMDGEYFSVFALGFKDGNCVLQGFSES